MTLRDHLAELRFRIVRVVLAVAVGFTIILIWYADVIDFLTRPYEQLCEQGTIKPATGQQCGELLSLSPIDAFGARVAISVYGGLILALPVIMWQIWRFVAPALHENEKKYAAPFILSSVGLFALGSAIAYWTLKPALQFLIGFGQATPAYQVSKYVSFVGLMAAAFGVGFQFPILLVFLQLAGIVKYRQLLGWWRQAIVVIVVVAAAITPSGDPISLFALAIPMTILYFVAILIGWFIARRRAKKAAAGTSAPSAPAET